MTLVPSIARGKDGSDSVARGLGEGQKDKEAQEDSTVWSVRGERAETWAQINEY